MPADQPLTVLLGRLPVMAPGAEDGHRWRMVSIPGDQSLGESRLHHLPEELPSGAPGRREYHLLVHLTECLWPQNHLLPLPI